MKQINLTSIFLETVTYFREKILVNANLHNEDREDFLNIYFLTLIGSCLKEKIISIKEFDLLKDIKIKIEIEEELIFPFFYKDGHRISVYSDTNNILYKEFFKV